MRTLGILICVSLLSHQLMSAQRIFVVGKGGVSSYGSVYIGNLGGGGGGDHHWESGPIISLGARIRTSEAFGFDAAVEYSTHQYEVQEWEDPPINDPANSVLDLTALGRSSFRVIGPVHFSFLFGLGLSSQHKDEIVRVYMNSRHTTPPSNEVTGCVILGVSLEVRVPDNLEFSLEGCLRGRRYVTPVAELGVAYLL